MCSCDNEFKRISPSLFSVTLFIYFLLFFFLFGKFSNIWQTVMNLSTGIARENSQLSSLIYGEKLFYWHSAQENRFAVLFFWIFNCHNFHWSPYIKTTSKKCFKGCFFFFGCRKILWMNFINLHRKSGKVFNFSKILASWTHKNEVMSLFIPENSLRC